MFKNLYKNIFFRKKNICILVLLLIIFGTFFVFWKKSILKDSIKKTSYLSQSIEYEKIIKKIDMKKPLTLKEANDFVIKNKNIYGTFTTMYLAKKYVLDNQLEPALMQLKNSLKYVQEDNLKHLLWLKIAIIQKEQNKNEDAITTLKNIKDHNWDNIIENIKGDIFFVMNQKKEAIKAWKKSQFDENSNASKEIINMKIQDLKSE